MAELGDEDVDVKPKPKIEVTVIYNGPTKQVFKFAMKRTTPFAKVFAATEDQVGAAPKTLKFLWNGQRLKLEDTLTSLSELPNYDEGDIEIDAVVEQIGGSIP